MFTIMIADIIYGYIIYILDFDGYYNGDGMAVYL